MKKVLMLLVLTTTLISLTNHVYAQQEILTTQWAYNKLTTNPAYTGAKDMFSARALHRQQWVGIDGRPITSVINVHSPLLNNRIALGMSYINDRLGVINTNYLALSYAYRLPFENNSTLAFGLNVGIETFKIESTDLEALDITDPILTSNINKINSKAGAGIYYYGKKFFVGVSTPNIIPNKLISNKNITSTDAGKESKQSIHLYLMGGYAFELANENVVIKPQALFKSVVAGDRKAPWQMDINLSFLLWQRLILGSTFRTTFANKNEESLENIASADLMMGVYITKQFFISYAYDFTLGSLKEYDAGSHEIMVGFDMNFKKLGAFTPRYF